MPHPADDCIRCDLNKIEQAALEPLRKRWVGKDMSRDGRAYSLTELLDDIGLWCEGEVD